MFSTRSGGASTAFFANAPTDGSTEELVVRTSQLCRTAPLADGTHEPCVSYHAYGFDLLSDSVDAVDGPAPFNPWAAAITQGDFLSVAPGGSTSANLSIDPSAWAQSPQLGEMVVSLDNKAGKDEAALLPLRLR